MTSKEKAKELIDKMYYSGRYDDKEDYNPDMAWERAKQCALIAVEEIKEILFDNDMMQMWDYWFEVKKEIEKL